MAKTKKKFWVLTKLFQCFFIVVFMACVIAAVAVYMKYGSFVLSLYSQAQEIIDGSSDKDFKAAETSLVYDNKGDLMRTLKGEKDLYYLDYESIPDNVKNALVSIEDKKFYQHNGIDIKRIAGAFVANVRHNGISQGGSTITQQLAKKIYLTDDQKYDRKVKEIFIALGLEKKYSKDQILEYYINNIYFSNGYYGIQAAANGYFRKSASSLSLSQTAFLCAIPNGPSLYDPYQHPENTLKRRDLILKEMYKDGSISKDEYDAALAEKIKVKKQKKAKINSVDSFVMDCATRALMKKNGFDFRYDFSSDAERESYEADYKEAYSDCESNLYIGGYRIYTSIDQDKEAKLQAAIDDTLINYDEIDETYKTYALQSSGTCIDNSTGRVVAIVGGRTQNDVEGYSLNRAFQSYRQPGSSIKPLIVYTPSLERGYTPDSIVSDSPIKDEKNAPKNSDGGYYGRITLRKAVASSRNVVAWRLFKELTPEVGIPYLVNMHYNKIVSSDYVLAAAVGGFTYGTNTMEQASGFGTLANEGVYREPTCIVSITDSDGNIVVSDEVEEKEVYDQNAALMMIDVMKDVMRSGTGAGLAIAGNMPCAGKTGTTDENKDGWFCGFSKYYTTSIWVGYDTPRTMQGLFGGTYPGKIWKVFMDQIHEGLEPLDWEKYTINGKKKDSTEEYDGTTEEVTEEKKKKEKEEEDDEEDYEDETEAPVVTEAPPVVTEAPIVTEAPPVVTEAPPVVTEAPVTQEPVVTEALAQ